MEEMTKCPMDLDLRNDSVIDEIKDCRSDVIEEEFDFLPEIAQTIPDVNPGAEEDDTEEEGPGGSAQTTGHSISENRTKTSTSSSGHQLSAAGQTAAVGFRSRGRSRKRLILESQVFHILFN